MAVLPTAPRPVSSSRFDFDMFAPLPAHVGLIDFDRAGEETTFLRERDPKPVRKEPRGALIDG